MGTSGVLSQLFGGGPDGKGKRISLAKRLDLVRYR